MSVEQIAWSSSVGTLESRSLAPEPPRPGGVLCATPGSRTSVSTVLDTPSTARRIFSVPETTAREVSGVARPEEVVVVWVTGLWGDSCHSDQEHGKVGHGPVTPPVSDPWSTDSGPTETRQEGAPPLGFVRRWVKASTSYLEGELETKIRL